MSRPGQTSHSGFFFVVFALVVVVALVLVSLGGRTVASHNCIDTGPGTGSSNSQCGADSFTIDMQDAGNTASGLPAGHTEVLGSVENCAVINENGVLDADEDAIDAVFFDVAVINVPTNPPSPHNPTGVIGLAYVIDYDSTNLTIAAFDSNFFLRANASSSLLDLSDAAPDDNFDNAWAANLLDTNSGDPEEGSGVFQRITLASEDTAATGTYAITVVGDGSHYTIDPDNDVQNPDAVVNGRVVINAGADTFTCATLTPPPTQGPTPTPTPTPTLPPQTISPTPTATPTPTPSLTPTPPPETPTQTPVVVCPSGGNDGFELGTPDTNAIPCWTVVDQAGGFGSWCNQRGTGAPGGPCAGSFSGVAPAPELLQAAMTGQAGFGSHLLYRCGFMASGHVSFMLYLKNENGVFYSPPSLDANVFPNQQFRADLVSAAAMASRPFTVDPLDVRQNLYQTQPGDPPISGYVTVSRDAGGLVGENLCIRFAEVDNQFFFEAGVDDVRISLGAAPTPTPSPTPTPTPTVGPGFHDASVKRLAAPASVHLLPGAPDTTGSLTTIVVANESDHSDTIAVLLAFVPPLGAANPGGCSPGGVLNLGELTLLAGKSITLKVDPEWLCENPSEVDGLPWTLKAFADIHADDGTSCSTLTQVFNGQCSAALANDDHDDGDNAKTRPRPRVVALTP